VEAAVVSTSTSQSAIDEAQGERKWAVDLGFVDGFGAIGSAVET
jgi:hypothetical protein